MQCVQVRLLAPREALASLHRPTTPAMPHRSSAYTPLINFGLQEMFPDAQVTSEANHSNRVVITACPKGAKKPIEVANVAQRDLYAKYGWPAKTTITDRLQMFKEEFE